jgi:hypothetical protein
MRFVIDLGLSFLGMAVLLFLPFVLLAAAFTGG